MSQIFKSLKENLKIVLAVMGVVLSFSFGIYLSKVVDRKLETIVNAQLDSIREKVGITLSIGKIETHFGTVTLSEVSLGATGWLVIDRIDLGISFNPFKDFLKPRDVKIGQAIIKVPWKRELWPAEINLLIEVLKSSRSKSNDKSGVDQNSQLSKKIPRYLSVEAARVELADITTTKFLAEHLKLTADVLAKRISYQVNQVQFLDIVQESFVEGMLKFEENDKLGLSAIHRPNFNGEDLWNFSCELSRNIQEVGCESKSAHLPISLMRQLQRTLGSGFSPGFSGSFKLTAINLNLKSTSTNNKEVSLKDWTLAKQWSVQVDGVFENIYLEHNTLAVVPIGPLSFRVNALAGIDLPTKRLVTKRSKIEWLPQQSQLEDRKSLSLVNETTIEGISTLIDGDITLGQNLNGGGYLSGNLQVDVDNVACSEVYRVIPKSFIPELDQFKLGGTLEFHGSVHLAGQSSEFSLRNSRFGCSVLKMPEIYSASYLGGAFVIERETPQGIVRIPVDPNRPYFSAYSEIPHLVRMAFVTSEDTGFYHHNGVEIGAIIGAAEKNTQVGRAAVGGSTITMQTVKNLFLARDKTISRKFQEMFLAWHIEKTISKERILEIYLNMVEFGPGLYGIGRASQRFFGKEAKNLSLKESIYLASLLPAPVPRYRYFCKGEVTPNYQKILQQLLDRMLTLGKISVEQHAQAKDENLVFSVLERESACAVASAIDSEAELRNEEMRE